MTSNKRPTQPEADSLTSSEAEAMLSELAAVFLNSSASASDNHSIGERIEGGDGQESPTRESMYRVLVDQIPAVVFIAYLDRGLGEAYVSPQIESALGFSQEEWLE